MSPDQPPPLPSVVPPRAPRPFNGLLTITNMPIKRFADFLHRRGELAEYMALPRGPRRRSGYQ